MDNKVIIVGPGHTLHRVSVIMAAMAPPGLIIETREHYAPPTCGFPSRLSIPYPLDPLEDWDLDIFGRDCNGFLWPGGGHDLRSKRKRWNWYLDHLAELRGDRTPAFQGVVPKGKPAARRWGARAREQRTKGKR